MRRKRKPAPQPDTANPRPDPPPERPADPAEAAVPPGRPLAVTMPESIPPRGKEDDSKRR